MHTGTSTVPAPRPSLALILPPEGIRVIRAVMWQHDYLRCGSIFIVDEHPISELCRALVAAGQGDAALAITWVDGSPCCFILSICDCARSE